MISGLPISKELIEKLKEKLNVGNLRSIQLNCIPGKSSTKLDIADLKTIDEDLPYDFIQNLVSKSGKLSFEISFSNLNLNFDSGNKDKSKELGLISKRLNSLYNYNKEDFQEYGYESFGFGFPVVVFRPQEAPNKVIKAPLFIWHLSIEKDLKKTNTWKVSRSRDHEIEFNNLLRSYAGQLSNTIIEGFTEEELVDGVLDIEELLENSVKFVQNFDNSAQQELLEKFKEDYSKGIRKIPSKMKCEENATGIPKIYWGGVFGRYHQRNEAIRQELNDQLTNVLEGNELDNNETDANKLMHSETAALTDPSQIGILNYLKDNKHLIIQGPPGTGKSESITGIIINALEHGKKCLVVCEKKTAMDVLKSNLSGISPEIGNLVAVIEDVSRDRKTIVESVRHRYEALGGVRHSKPPETNLAETLEMIESHIEDIHYRKKFFYEKQVVNDKKTKGWTAAVGKELQARFKNKDKHLLDKLKKNINDIDGIEYNEAINSLRQLEAGVKKLNYKNLLKLLPNNKFGNVNASRLQEELEAAVEVNTSQLDDFITDLIKRLDQIRNEAYKKIDEIIEEIRLDIENLRKKVSQFSAKPSFKKKNTWFKILNSLPFKSERLKQDIKSFKEAINTLGKISQNVDQLDVQYSFQFSTSVENIKEKCNELEIWLDEFCNSLGDYRFNIYDSIIHQPFLGIQLDKRTQEALEKWKIKSEEVLNNYFAKNVNWNSTTATVEHLKWYLKFSDDIKMAINDGFFKHFDWQDRLRDESEIIQELVQFFIEEKVDDWESHFSEYFYHDQLVKNLNIKFSGGYDTELKFLREERDRIVNEIKGKIPKYWKSIQSEVSVQSDLRGINIPQLYNLRGGRGRRRNSLRKIADISFDSLTAYFPVIMVSPNVCASMFKLEPDLFDYVIFDEASQLKIEESLTTLIRGERKVISGDSNQMPPSYWFTAQNDTDDVLDDDYDPYQSWQENLLNESGARDLADSESLLEFAELCKFKSFYLDFHYRSHHPLLIEFSNAAFYRSRLHPLPERIAQSPIQFIPVNGTYEDQQNRDEANIVIEALKQIKRNEIGELPSVGIATFNRKQKNLIWDLLKREAQLNSDFRNRYRELEERGLFVKNLENIQGDERDIIILSTTFGKDKSGRAIRNYGPITRNSLGRRLLNVIITRAKKKIFVLTSVPEDYYMNYKQELSGSNIYERGFFHAYLAYAKAVSDKDKEAVNSILNFLESRTTKVNIDTLGLTESPFEEAVYQALVREIDEERITLQHKAGGFRIDIAIKSKKTGKEFIAIECDGAAYHSSVEAYSWDMYRQEILEEYGFVFHRIWSREFWENSEREINKLVNFIREQDEKDQGFKALQDPVASDLFIEDVFEQVSFEELDDKPEIVEKENVKADLEKSNPTPKRETNQQLELKEIEIVRVDDTVTLLEVDTEKKIKVAFKKGKKNVTETNGITILNDKSPLGEAVIGRKVGETIELNNIEKYYKIISITD
ncbi:AAA domain-containing protein [Gracilimonas sediminicola]|uniref:AAA domain-containing protein n=1 Tax=Gracilimonas sediminicola TaxID=2952158 RepID=UPI0038D3688C